MAGNRRSPASIAKALMHRADLDTYTTSDPMEQALLAVWRRALDGDVKSLQYLIDLTGESNPTADTTIRIELGPGVEELCQ